MKTLIPCLVCGKELDSFTPDIEEVNHPEDGTAFHSSGHYGSIYDPMSSQQQLEINICNECLEAAAKLNRVAVTIFKKSINTTLTVWDAS